MVASETKKKASRADKVIAFIQKYCRVPEGPTVGQRIKLEEFQIKFIRDVYDRDVPVRRAILSMARKNAKTTLIAAIMLVHLVGPEALQNTQIISGAMSKEQAAIVFDLAAKMVRLEPRLDSIIRIVDSKKRMYGLLMQVEYRALSAEGKTAHGLSPVLAILDETGQVQGTTDPFIEAITTSQGAHKNPLLIVISTQAATDGDLLSIWIDDALRTKDPRIVCHLYTAPVGCDLLDESAWYAANPALGIFRGLDDLRTSMEEASRLPSQESSARNLLLNQRVSTKTPAISKSVWDSCKGELPPIEECEEFYGGIDLSGRLDLTAFVLLGRKGDFWYCYAWFFAPEKGIEERSKRDRAPYSTWAQQGHIITTPGASVDYEWVALKMKEICSPLENITAIAYDRWRIDLLKKEMEELGFELPLKPWGQGFKDMAPALDSIESKLLNGKVIHGGNPVLTMCAANSTIVKNPAGDKKLDKIKSTGRIDGYVAMAMACGIADGIHESQGDFNDFLKSPVVL